MKIESHNVCELTRVRFPVVFHSESAGAFRPLRYRYWVKVIASTLVAAIACAHEGGIDFQMMVATGFHSSKPIYAAINSQDKWRGFWNSQNTDSLGAPTVNHSPLPAVDFDKFTLLVISSGTKGSSGSSLAITSVSDSAGTITVSVVDIGAGPSCPTLQELVMPRIFALIPKSNERVDFVVHHATLDCASKKVIH